MLIAAYWWKTAVAVFQSTSHPASAFAPAFTLGSVTLSTPIVNSSWSSRE